MSVLRKYPKLEPKPRRRLVTVDRGLLAGVVALAGFGMVQTKVLTMASNEAAKPTLTALRPVADYTPVGTIEPASKADQKKANATLAPPFGLKPVR